MTLGLNLQYLQEQITLTTQEVGRESEQVLIVAASKQQSVAQIEKIYSLGIAHFGENYYQEAIDKIHQLNHLPLIWHFIGPIQSNKTRGIARHFSWVHSIERDKIAQQLNAHRAPDMPPIQVCIQVNLVGEKTKSGVSAEKTVALAQLVQQLPRLKLRGLMTILPLNQDPEKQYNLYLELQQLLQQINQQLGTNLDTLSMGMSQDFKPAIRAGSTIIRIGEALFGKRQK